MVEGGHHPRNRPPTLGTTLVDFYHYPVTVWAYSTPQPNTEVPPPTGGRRWGRVSNTSNEDLKDGHLVQQATDLVQQVNHLVFKHTQICFSWQERICMFFFFFCCCCCFFTLLSTCNKQFWYKTWFTDHAFTFFIVLCEYFTWSLCYFQEAG